MTTISHVKACQPDTMAAFGEHLIAKNAVFAGKIGQLDRDVDNAMNTWKGEGAAAASTRALSHKLAGNHVGSAVVSIADRYNDFGVRLAGIRTPLLNIVTAEAPSAGMTVDDRGNVTAPKVPYADVHPTFKIMQQRLDGQAAAFQSRIQALLNDFEVEETKAAQAIRAGLEQLAGLQKSPDGPPLSPAVQDILAGRAQLPTDPKQLRDFWDKLTPAEKDALFQRDHFLGNRDGIPQADRDYYNRQNLEFLRDGLSRRLDYLYAHPLKVGDMLDQKWIDEVEAVKRQLAGYDKVKETLAMKDGVPRLLSMIDDRGHAAVALRNPDTAGNVVTFVPGTGSRLEKMEDVVNRSEALRRAAEQADPSRPTSAVAWLGYDAPQSFSDAASDDGAKGAAGPLDRFQSGLRATHDGPPSTNTVVGHSYGTTAIGHAASNDHTLDADKVILVASPGIDVDRPSKFHLTGVAPEDSAKHIYSTTAQHDWIRLVAGSHGPAPVSTPGFGTNFTSNDQAGPWYQFGWSGPVHNNYFGVENPIGLENMGKIISGRGQIR